ncbi:MAG TPA: MBL fold metallo-hydrolase [Acidimicrobiales bacterium]
MQITPMVDEGLGNAAWLVDLGDGRLLVVDPSRDVASYEAWAEQRDRRFAFSAETHLHADFVSGSRALASAGATVLSPAASRLGFGHRGLDDGDEVDLGGLRLRALATPGHAPEHMAYLLVDGEQPLALFSGGSLLVGSVARTDLVSPEQTEELARAAYRSLHDRLVGLPDDLTVYPTHGAGSFCSAPAGNDRATTIGREHTTNPLLRAADEDAFVAALLGGLGTYPPYFGRLRDINRRGPRVYARPPGLRQLTVAETRMRVEAGADLIDVRPVRDFAAGHVPGALSIPLRPEFPTWLGWLVAEGRDLVFVVGEGQDRTELARQCLKVGYEELAGELAGGSDAWAASGLKTEHIELIGPGSLGVNTVLDVRQASEREVGHIPGSLHVELGSLAERTGDLPPGPITLMCGHGERAMSGASLLSRAGGRQLAVLVGGPAEWAHATGSRLALGP